MAVSVSFDLKGRPRHDETQAYELEHERVDAFDGTEERGLVHELSVKNSLAVLGSE